MNRYRDDSVMLQPAHLRQLTSLVSRAAALDDEIKDKGYRLGVVKEQIREFVEKHKDHLPVVSSSRVIPLSTIGKQLRVTYVSLAPRFDYYKLHDTVGGEIFQRVTVATAWELIPEEVNKAIADELLKESDLHVCLQDAPARKPSVSWDILKGAAVEGEKE